MQNIIDFYRGTLSFSEYLGDTLALCEVFQTALSHLCSRKFIPKIKYFFDMKRGIGAAVLKVWAKLQTVSLFGEFILRKWSFENSYIRHQFYLIYSSISEPYLDTLWETWSWGIQN